MPSNVSQLPVPSGRRGDAPLEVTRLEALCAALESGASLIEVVRAASQALDMSLVLVDRSRAVIAAAARSPAEEQALVAGGKGVQTVELVLSDEVVGRLRVLPRSESPAPAAIRAVAVLLALEVQRVAGPDRASASATGAFLRALVDRELTGREEIIEAAAGLGLDLEGGASMIVVRAHQIAPVEEDWRGRMLSLAERAARAVAAGSLATARGEEEGPVGEVVLLVPAGDGGEEAARKVAAGVLHELDGGISGLRLTVGVSGVARDAVDLHRAANEALLAANVADGEGAGAILSFDQTGAYRLLLSVMSENPDELQRFFAETIEPIIAYDEQYETDLVQTLETYLDSDGNVAGTAQKLFTHRHTVRYRLDRVRELCGHDVTSSDGREKLSLGLKAMRVLGIPSPRGPASETGAEAGRVPRESKDRR